MIEHIIESFMDGQFAQMRRQARRYGKRRTYVEIYQHDTLSKRDKLDMIYMIATR
jgi:hypothetical protein